MTANAMTGDDQKCKAAGCSDYLSKPIDLNRLLELVENIQVENARISET